MSQYRPFRRVHAKYNDKDDDGGGDDDGWSDLDQPDESDLDASDSEADDRDDDSDEDEEAALQAELAKIRAEREAEKRKAEAEVSFERCADTILRYAHNSILILLVRQNVGGCSRGSKDGRGCFDWKSFAGLGRGRFWHDEEALE